MEIPESVGRLLWEYDLGAEAPEEAWRSAVIERVMLRGGWDQMRWLAMAFDRPILRAFLERRGCRALPPRELRFWATVAEVPTPVADRWVTEARDREQRWRG